MSSINLSAISIPRNSCISPPNFISPDSLHLEFEKKSKRTSQETLEEKGVNEQEQRRVPLPLHFRIGTCIKKFFTERLRQFFHGIAISFKSGEAKKQLNEKIQQTIKEINSAIENEKFGNKISYPLLSEVDISFMYAINRTQSFSGMEMVRILDIEKKVKERLETYPFIDKFATTLRQEIPHQDKRYQFILKLHIKLIGEDGMPQRPLGERERNKLRDIIATFPQNLNVHLETRTFAAKSLSNELDKMLQADKPDLDDLAEKLLVPIEKLREKEGMGTVQLVEYVRKKSVKYGAILEQAKVDYAQISAKYVEQQVQEKERLLLPKADIVDGIAAPGLNQKMLMKVIRKANLALSKTKNGDTGAVAEIKTGPGNNHKWHILAARTVEGLQVVQWSGEIHLLPKDPNYLGKGSYGTVQKAHDIANATIVALKLAMNREDYISNKINPSYANELADKARIDVLNEAKKITQVNGKTQKPGLQKRPIASIQIAASPKNISLCGYWGGYYNMRSLDDAINELKFMKKSFNSHQRLTMALPLFQGLKVLETATNDSSGPGPIVHGDIKPANIVIHERNDGICELGLADFGDAKDLRKELPLSKRLRSKPFGTTTTPGYFTKSDKQCLSQAATQKDWEKYQMKRDLFALASSVWELLIDRMAYHWADFDNPNDNWETNDMTAKTNHGLDRNDVRTFKTMYGEPLANLFMKALDENPDNRPSVDEMVAGIEEALQILNANSPGIPLR